MTPNSFAEVVKVMNSSDTLQVLLTRFASNAKSMALECIVLGLLS